MSDPVKEGHASGRDLNHRHPGQRKIDVSITAKEGDITGVLSIKENPKLIRHTVLNREVKASTTIGYGRTRPSELKLFPLARHHRIAIYLRATAAKPRKDRGGLAYRTNVVRRITRWRRDSKSNAIKADVRT